MTDTNAEDKIRSMQSDRSPTPKVYSRRKDAEPAPPGAIYVGRPTKWGNPFVVGRDGTRADVIQKYREWLSPELRAAARRELAGKDLVCWCAPLACHANVLLEIANAPD